jgi:hypothetical protein
MSRGNTVSEGVVHDILRNDRRRNAIKYLQENVGEAELRDLSEAIAEMETGESPPPRNIRDSVYNSLHQSHLPKLDQKGFIDYDRDRKTIELTDRVRHLDVYMEVVNRYGVTWASYYRGLATVALFVIVLTQIDVPVLASVDPLLVASVFLGGVAVSTAVQLWSRRWLYLNRLMD